jgi:hypothetical protein
MVLLLIIQVYKLKPNQFDCYHCGTPGHKKTECPELIGQPKSDTTRGRGRGCGRGCGHYRGNDHKANTNETAVTFMLNSDDYYDDHWYLDSGCTQHMCNNEKFISEKFPKKAEVTAALNQKISTEYAGCARLDVKVGSEIISVSLENCLIVPKL